MSTKAVVLIGSARRRGNTEMLCDSVSQGMASADADVTVMFPYGMDIGHCTNCGGCDSTGVCVIDDDMSIIYEEVAESDVIVLGTPVHFSGTSSILKQVIDRFQCLWRRGPEARKRMQALVAVGGSDEPNFKNIVSVSKAVANTLGADWGGQFTAAATDGGLSNETLDGAYVFGKGLADAFKERQ